MNNGSRILITTRYQDVAKHTSSIPNNVHSFRLFTERESYELFEKKLGLKDYHSEHLLRVGHQIALSCKGLPLAIAIVAGHLAKADKNVEEWKKFLEGLSSSILNDKDRPYRVMLEWSYKCLPNHLKPCFLYARVLAAYEPVRFPELKLLWIAEGLVCDHKLQPLEKQAEDYLMDLINRSLVIPTRERAIGGIKEFRMHDLLKDFCLELSKELNFMHKIEDETDGLQKVRFWLRRYDFHIGKPSGSSSGSGHFLRSLVRFPFASFGEDALAAINSMDFNLLQVLDMRGGSQSGDIFDRIQFLTHLKYLAIVISYSASYHIPSYHIPSSIASLTSLQTFILDGFGKSEVTVPDSLWDMENLRNVDVRAGDVRFEVESSRPEKSSFSENIETLSTPLFSSASDTQTLRRMPMLRKLRFKYGNCQIPNMDFLTQLMSLKISVDYAFGQPVRQCNLNFPSNLIKLTLRDCLISWDEISNLGRKLPNLEVLKLHCTGDGGTWTVMTGDFPNLRYLKITMNFSITEWSASEESFPKLEHLHLGFLPYLEEIPCCLGDAICLWVITVEHCQRISLYESATRIETVQKEEVLNEEFVSNVGDRVSPLKEGSLQMFENQGIYKAQFRLRMMFSTKKYKNRRNLLNQNP